MLNHIPDPLGANLNSNLYTTHFFPIYYKGGNRFNNCIWTISQVMQTTVDT